MKISIITVCFNSAETISDTMRSVAMQSYKDVEHIIIDGGSNDGTMEIVQAASLSPSHVISEPDAGIYDAMNKGLTLATGDFIGFLNSDDMLAGPNVVASIAAAASTEVDAIYGDLSYVQKNQPNEVIRYWKSGEFSIKKLRYGWMPPHPTFYIRRSTMHELGEFDLQFRIAADYDLMLRFLKNSNPRIKYLSEVLVNMRVGGASNKSLYSMILKSSEDLTAIRNNQIGGIGTLICKNARKLPQFFLRKKVN